MNGIDNASIVFVYTSCVKLQKKKKNIHWTVNDKSNCFISVREEARLKEEAEYNEKLRKLEEQEAKKQAR